MRQILLTVDEHNSSTSRTSIIRPRFSGRLSVTQQLEALAKYSEPAIRTQCWRSGCANALLAAEAKIGYVLQAPAPLAPLDVSQSCYVAYCRIHRHPVSNCKGHVFTRMTWFWQWVRFGDEPGQCAGRNTACCKEKSSWFCGWMYQIALKSLSFRSWCCAAVRCWWSSGDVSSEDLLRIW